ncbi:MAG: beta-ketoacyl-[acyl-carrier-protein] synthase family protein [Spirochaetales bacterium]|nr:MAG: beta-ketoacyl-[acyl-carrier-protein] synthase family protein [Spirochaetales bacterium]
MKNNRKNPYETRVVVTGLGTVNPIGNTVEDYWDNLVKGKSGVRISRNVDVSDYNIKIAAEVDLPDLTPYFKFKKMIKRLDRYVILAHIAGTQAVQSSGLDTSLNTHRYGSLIGTGDGGLETQIDTISKIKDEGMQATSPYYVVSTIPSTASAFLAKEYNLQGPSFSVNSACSTGNIAFAMSAMLIKMGFADVMFAGGSEAVINSVGLSGFGNIMALSDRNDSPETASRPFDADRNGFVLGEGAGVICLEELEHAKKRKAHIICELTGVGFSCDAYDLVAPHPDAKGTIAAMRNAIDDAGLNPEDVSLINAHGTSTPMGDRIESNAINMVFGEYGAKIPTHSTKSMTGHLLGGASAIEAVAIAQVFEKSVIHPSINLFRKDPGINLNIITEPRENNHVKHVLSNAFGFGGQNCSVIFSKFEG